MIRPGSSKATNNDVNFTALKIKLRMEAIKNVEAPFILDCFAGKSILWNAEIKKTKKKIKRISIDANEKFNVDYNINALKYLKGNDISVFNIIDLDSWGSPVNYLEEVFKSNFKGFVLCTYCSPVSLNPDKLLAQNYFGDIYKNTSKKSLLAKNIGLMFKQYLYKNKITEYKGYMDNKKIYCIFEIK